MAIYGRRTAELLSIVALFLTPSIAMVLGGFQGFYLTYSVWSFVIALSIPFVVFRRGLGSIETHNSLTVALVLISLYTFLGFVFGFAARPSLTFFSFLSGLAVFLVRILGVEVARSMAMGLARKRFVMLLIGTVVGMFFGETIPSIVNYVQHTLLSPINMISDFVYSFTISLIHLHGGFLPALVFRTVVDGYWRFSPLALDTSSLGVAWKALSALTYYVVATYIDSSTPKLKHFAKNVFKRGSVRRFLGIAIDAAIFVTIFLILYSIYMKIIPLVVISESMVPTLYVGDIVLVDTKKPLDVSIGDIVVFKIENKVVVHRVIEVYSHDVRTKGDNNPNPDPFIVPTDNIIGKVVGRIPRLGLVTIFFRQNIIKIVQKLDMFLMLFSTTLILVISGVMILYLKRNTFI